MRQPRDLALLNSVQECISTSIVLDSTLTTSISSQVNMCFDYFFREINFMKNFVWKWFSRKIHKIYVKMIFTKSPWIFREIKFYNFFKNIFEKKFLFQSVEYNSIEEKQTKADKNSSEVSSDPCLNYCYHGSCYLTSFGVPICNCNFNFSGMYFQSNRKSAVCLLPVLDYFLLKFLFS